MRIDTQNSVQESSVVHQGGESSSDSRSTEPISELSTLRATISELKKDNRFELGSSIVSLITKAIDQYRGVDSSKLGRKIKDIKGTEDTRSLKPEEKLDDPGKMEFKEFVKDLLRPDANFSISEEKLQYGIISYQLHQKSASLQKEYRANFEEARDDGMKIKEAAKHALERLYEDGKIKNWELDWVYSLSHRAAQLDKSHGGINNKSSEAITFEQALKSAELGLVGIQAGTIEVKERGPLDVGWSIELQNDSIKQREESKSRDVLLEGA